MSNTHRFALRSLSLALVAVATACTDATAPAAPPAARPAASLVVSSGAVGGRAGRGNPITAQPVSVMSGYQLASGRGSKR